jgi:hypothetical protein
MAITRREHAAAKQRYFHLARITFVPREIARSDRNPTFRSDRLKLKASGSLLSDSRKLQRAARASGVAAVGALATMCWRSTIPTPWWRSRAPAILVSERPLTVDAAGAKQAHGSLRQPQNAAVWLYLLSH